MSRTSTLWPWLHPVGTDKSICEAAALAACWEGSCKRNLLSLRWDWSLSFIPTAERLSGRSSARLGSHREPREYSSVNLWNLFSSRVQNQCELSSTIKHARLCAACHVTRVQSVIVIAAPSSACVNPQIWPLLFHLPVREVLSDFRFGVSQSHTFQHLSL